MSRIQEIITGWKNLLAIDLDPEIKQLGELRMRQCTTCTLMSFEDFPICNPASKGVNIVTGKIESGCGCPLASKTLSPTSKCPLSKW